MLKVNDHTKNGKCSQCGQCCGNFLPISNSEIAQIKKYLSNHPEIHEQKNMVSLKDSILTCPFRDDAHAKCLIYEVRPQICRSFMCNQSQQEIESHKADFYEFLNPVAMRETFFGDGDSEKAIMKLLEILGSEAARKM